MSLFPSLKPRTGTLPPGIDLRCCDVAEVLREARGARLIHADPPWVYSHGAGKQGAACDHYDLLTMPQIAGHVEASFDCAAADCRLAVWYTWPQSDAWETETILRREGFRPGGWRWGPKLTGGSWHKEGGKGVGYHWIGGCEPVAVYKVGSPPFDSSAYLRSGYSSEPEAHSEKPTEWLRGMLRRWTSPGDLVVDLYAGLAPMARACALEGRRYIGAEIDPERHRRAVLRVEDAYNRR